MARNDANDVVYLFLGRAVRPIAIDRPINQIPVRIKTTFQFYSIYRSTNCPELSRKIPKNPEKSRKIPKNSSENPKKS